MLATVSGSPPSWGSWDFEPIVAIVSITLVWWYAKAYRAEAGGQAHGEGAAGGRPLGEGAPGGRAHGEGAPGGRPLGEGASGGRPLGATWWVPFAFGVALLALAGLSPLASLADGWLLSAATLQHVLLSDVAPALIVLGMRAPLLSGANVRLPAIVERLLAPWLVIPAWIAVTWLWAVPAVGDYAASHYAVGLLSHLTLIATGFALWWLIVDPLPGAEVRPNGQRMAFLGVTHVASAIVCLPMMWLAHTQYPLFAAAPRALSISAIDDQHAAGGLMSFVEFLVFGLAFAGVFVSILTRADVTEEAPPVATARAGTAGTRR